MQKLVIFITLFSFIYTLIPDKDNAITITENEIKCNKGLFTYKIMNSKNKKYFLFVKGYYIKDYDLYEGDTELSYESNSYNDYIYSLKGNDYIYIVVQTYSSYCISFQFLDKNMITLDEKKEYVHPIVDYYTNIVTTIKNVYKKEIILYCKNIYSSITVYFDNQEVHHYYSSSEHTFQFLSESNEIKLNIKIDNQNILASIVYETIPYSNITSSTFECNLDSNYVHSYLIKRNETEQYLFISFSNTNYELYEKYLSDDFKIISGINFKKKYSESYLYLIRIKNKGCFQILYSKESDITFNGTCSFKILNSEPFKFKIEQKSNIQRKDFILYSNNDNYVSHLEGKNKDIFNKYDKNSHTYFYHYYSDEAIEIAANFSLNSQNYIEVKFAFYNPEIIYLEKNISQCFNLKDNESKIFSVNKSNVYIDLSFNSNQSLYSKYESEKLYYYFSNKIYEPIFFELTGKSPCFSLFILKSYYFHISNSKNPLSFYLYSNRKISLEMDELSKGNTMM